MLCTALQDPVVFSGTLRDNLDPFESHTDDEIWQVLEYAHLKGVVASLNEGLLYQCGEGGESLRYVCTSLVMVIFDSLWGYRRLLNP